MDSHFSAHAMKVAADRPGHFTFDCHNLDCKFRVSAKSRVSAALSMGEHRRYHLYLLSTMNLNYKT